MKFIVDKLPNNSQDCIFSKWHPYPPIIEEAGYYECVKCKMKCNLSREESECHLLKEGKYE